MSGKIVVLIGSSLASGKATTNFNLLREFLQAGRAVQVCLLQDGVLAGLDSGWANVARAQAPGARFCALDEDLALRGLGPQDLTQGVESLTYGELVEAMMGDGAQVIGVL
jgi:sulfur relay protein TusB/DsrH